MKEKNIVIWVRELDWLVEHGVMALVITHPDYMNLTGENIAYTEYPVQYYEDFLKYVQTKYEGQYWHVLPRDMARFWYKNVYTSSN